MVSLEEVILTKENKVINGIIIKSSSKYFTVLAENIEYSCSARGNIKLTDKKLLVGDAVTFQDGVITAILPRRNSFNRPRVANIDCINIVIAPAPKPDFLLVDKMIVEANRASIPVYLTVNKRDTDDEIYHYVLKHYDKAVDCIFGVSAFTGEGFDELKIKLKDNLCCLVGQSAVGKTSICNRLFEMVRKTNAISDKTERGRHTTTSREILYNENLFVMDTPGFSVIDAAVKSEELSNFYKDFKPYNGKCYYIGCSHDHEPDCLVKEAVLNGEISQDRYNRYLTIYKELKEYEKRKY